MPCPARYAWALHKAWPEADFHLIEGAGHAYSEPGILDRSLIRGDREIAARHLRREARSSEFRRQDNAHDRERLYLFDTTLRDGQQTPGIDFSVEDKIAIAKTARRVRHRLCRGRLSRRQPDRHRVLRSRSARQRANFVAFGMTKRAGVSASNDPGLAALVQAKSDAICFVAKSWDYHVRVALGCTNEENLDVDPRLGRGGRRRRQGGDGRLRAFLRRLQGQSGLCAGLRQDGLRCRRALGRAVRHQWRHAAVGSARHRRQGDRLRHPGRPSRHPRP